MRQTHLPNTEVNTLIALCNAGRYSEAESQVRTLLEQHPDFGFKAVTLTSDLPKLATLRAGLRQQVLASPLFDAPRFARNFEDALWGMWQTRTHSNFPPSGERLSLV